MARTVAPHAGRPGGTPHRLGEAAAASTVAAGQQDSRHHRPEQTERQHHQLPPGRLFTELLSNPTDHENGVSVHGGHHDQPGDNGEYDFRAHVPTITPP